MPGPLVVRLNKLPYYSGSGWFELRKCKIVQVQQTK